MNTILHSTRKRASTLALWAVAGLGFALAAPQA